MEDKIYAGQLRDTENGCEVWNGEQWIFLSTMTSTEVCKELWEINNRPIRRRSE